MTSDDRHGTSAARFQSSLGHPSPSSAPPGWDAVKRERIDVLLAHVRCRDHELVRLLVGVDPTNMLAATRGISSVRSPHSPSRSTSAFRGDCVKCLTIQSCLVRELYLSQDRACVTRLTAYLRHKTSGNGMKVVHWEAGVDSTPPPITENSVLGMTTPVQH